ncbi:MAG: class I SAM-dependent methyltransferase [Bacteroidota bacterium]
MSIKKIIKNIPIVGGWIVNLKRFAQYKLDRGFQGSKTYWEERYAQGGNSGAGSYGRLANFKTQILTAFLQENNIGSVVEFGCGDGNQLSMIPYREYVGLDVSRSVILRCAERFRADNSKSFFLFDPMAFCDRGGYFKHDMALSLDVIYHIIEDDIFEKYMQHVFASARRFVVLYSTDYNSMQMKHVKHREVTRWVNKNIPDWTLEKVIDNPFPYSESDPDNTSDAKFIFFSKKA